MARLLSGRQLYDNKVLFTLVPTDFQYPADICNRTMGQRQEPLPHPGFHIACKPAAVCIQESWSELHVLPERKPRALPVNDTEAILFALAQAVEQRDHHTAGHCERMAFVGVALGVTMGLEHASLVALYRGGFLHDIGKVGIPDRK